MRHDYIIKIAKELGLSKTQVGSTIQLLNDGATIPFISRYRKEATGSLDEVQIANIRDRNEQLIALDKRRDAIIESIDEQGLLTDELHEQLKNALVISELEDIYLPYKPKRKTRATIAKAKGLEPLAKILMSQKYNDIEQYAAKYVDESKEVNSIEEALAGARDIIAEWINENQFARKRIRSLFEQEAILSAKVVKGKEEEGEKYKNYFKLEESLKKAPSHRVLAIFRGENEGFLKVSTCPSSEKAIDILNDIFLNGDNESSNQVELAIADAYKRLLEPSLENEIRALAKEKADLKAIEVFVENVRQLLLAPPLGQKNVLAIDPGFRSGCKIVCLDKQGNLLHNENIYPHPPQSERKQALHKILSLVNAYKIEAIAIGNGTAGRETEAMIRKIRFDKDIVAVMVNESGASVYSASTIAREEFPEYDVTVRGAVSIGRRLMDPLAELVKIDPKSIGVGQYQHDVNQTQLQKSLEDTVVSCVNSVGVEVNTASKQLLQFVSGVGPVLAQNIIDYRSENGPFKSREELKKVKRFGDKAFEQAAGFLRIRDGINPLDKSAVHPESYGIVAKMAKKLKVDISDLIARKNIRQEINANDFVTEKVGLPTLNDILDELEKPGRDPRKKFDFFEFDKNVNSMNDLVKGMKLPSIVTNITAFGAFVDIGVHQDGLVHISQMADRYISDPNEIVTLNQKVMVTVVDVDVARKRIQLSMKEG
ncbi:MAG: RNA-binding transcriptional accessory protein [Saprospiraceae bacterium]|nr:RNA-binding transcriptional accessory protein [Saprospiraceae bacterium]